MLTLVQLGFVCIEEYTVRTEVSLKKSFPARKSSALLDKKSYWMFKAATELIPLSCHLWRPKLISQNDKKTQTNDTSSFIRTWKIIRVKVWNQESHKYRGLG